MKQLQYVRLTRFKLNYRCIERERMVRQFLKVSRIDFITKKGLADQETNIGQRLPGNGLKKCGTQLG